MTEINKANKLQEQLNKLKQEMINQTKANNEMTSKHNKKIRWLTLAIVILGIITIWASYNKTGRYAMSSDDTGSVFVLDTKTSQVWLRTPRGNNYDWGTNENSKRVSISSY